MAQARDGGCKLAAELARARATDSLAKAADSAKQARHKRRPGGAPGVWAGGSGLGGWGERRVWLSCQWARRARYLSDELHAGLACRDMALLPGSAGSAQPTLPQRMPARSLAPYQARARHDGMEQVCRRRDDTATESKELARLYICEYKNPSARKLENGQFIIHRFHQRHNAQKTKMEALSLTGSPAAGRRQPSSLHTSPRKRSTSTTNGHGVLSWRPGRAAADCGPLKPFPSSRARVSKRRSAKGVCVRVHVGGWCLWGGGGGDIRRGS